MHKHVTRLTKALKYWLPFATTLVVVAGMIYLAVQQNYRMSANDPQIQISEDYAELVGKGNDPTQIIPPDSGVEAGTSLAPLLVFYDISGKPITSSIKIDGKNPSLPSGVFDYAKAHGQDRFTWQPRKDLRYAAVLTKINSEKGGYVLAAKSLREVEKLERNLTLQVGTALAAGLAATLILCFLLFGDKETLV